MSSMSSPLLGGGLGAGTGSDGSTSSPPKGSRAAAAAAADRGKQVIVLGWPEAAVPDLLLQLQEAMRGGGHVTVVVPAQAEQQLVSNASAKQLLKQAGSAKVQQGAGMWHVQYVRVTDPSSTQTLLDAGIADADAVILGSALSAAVAPASTEADALVTAAILAVQQALQTAKGATSTQQQQQQLEVAAGSGVSQQQPPSKLHVVAVVSSYSVRRALQTFLSSVLLQCSFSYEIMVLDEFAAGMLVSVSGVLNMLYGWLHSLCAAVLWAIALTLHSPNPNLTQQAVASHWRSACLLHVACKCADPLATCPAHLLQLGCWQTTAK